MANRRFIDFPIASTVGDNDIVLIWQDGANKQTTKATILSGLPENLDELNDVVISGLTNGQILRYDSVTGKWVNTDQGNLDLNDLNDVSIVSPSNGQVLVYNSSTSKWENSSGGFVPYVGAVTTVDLGAQGLRAGYVRFDTSVVTVPDEQGLMYWDESRSTVALIMNGTLQHIGQDSFFYVKNSSGSTIPKGTCVGFAGTDGGSGHLLVTPFLANGSVPSTYFMGVTSEEIANGAFGQVMHFGELDGINTSGFTAGALLYASSTVAGAFQTTAPVAPNNIILVAAAVNSKNNGAIVVRPTLGSNINSDEGVKITSPTTGDLLQLQAGGLWENKTLAQVIGSAYVPSTRTLTINGTTQDLSANRTFNVGTVTSVGLSSATSGVTIGSTPVTSSGTITLAIATASGSQNGLLSSTDWTTFNNKQNALTNPVTGTGTTNRLAKFTGASTIGNSNISDGGVTIFNENPTAGQFAWQFNGNTTTGQSFGASVVAGTNSSDIAFRVLNASASTTHLLVKGDGNLIVGGTTDNGEKLQVNGEITAVTRIRINKTTQTNQLFGDGNAFTGGTSGDLGIRNDSGRILFASGGGTIQMLLNSSGNLGLGVTPSAWNSSVKVIEIANTGNFIGNSGNDNWLATNTIYDSGATFRYARTGSAVAFYSQSSGGHFWFNAPIGTAGNAISLNQAMTLFSTGNLSIGSATDTSYRLFVNGNTYIRSGGNTSASFGLVVQDSSANNLFLVRNDGAATFSSNVTAASIASNNGGFRLKESSQTSSRNWIIGNDWLVYGDLGIGQSTTQTGSSYTYPLYINPSGNVGIGTSSPERDSGTRSLAISGASSLAASLDLYGNARNFAIFTGGAGSLGFFDLTGGAQRMTITSGGNVLIGTTTDNGQRLQVNGNMLVSGSVRFTASGTDANRWSVYWNGANGDLIVVNNISDIRAKKDFDYNIKGLETITKLKPLKFTWKDGISKSTSVSGKLRQYGFIAQETMEADNYLAWHNERQDTWGIEQYESFCAVIVKAIQEQQEIINDLKQKIQ